MSDNVTQTLGFDASSAIAALQQYDRMLDRVSNSTREFGSALDKFNGTKATAAVGKLGQSFDKNLGRASERVTKLTVDWTTMGRIITTQAIVRGLSAMRNAFEESFTSAVKFQEQVARTLTIAPAGQTFEGLAEQVRKLSDEFNVPLQDVAAGLNQAISNQVGNNLDEQTQFLRTALKFSKSTGSSVANSVDLISGALTSFKLDVSQSDEVAGQFFRTIDLGRVEANQLANTFGRVGPQAAQLGIRMDELNAAISSTTLPGVNTSEALTQLRGIMTALAKPTDAMKEALGKLGATSAEGAISMYRFDGLLDALAKTTDGTSASFAKLFPNVRGLSGAITLGKGDLEGFAANIRKVASAGSELNDSKWLQATATDAERATKELNKLKNSLTVDLGNALVESTARSFEWIGGAETLIDVAKSAGFAIAGLGSAAALFATKSKLGIDGATKLGKSLNFLTGAAAVVGVGASVGDFIGRSIDDASNARAKALEEANQRSLEAFQKQQQEILRINRETAAQRVQAILAATKEASKAYAAEVSAVAAANRQLVADAEATIKGIIGAREAYLRELQRAADESRQIVRASEDRISDLRIRADDSGFERSLRGADDAAQARALLDRSRSLAEQAVQQLSQAVDSESVSRALQTFGRAEVCNTTEHRPELPTRQCEPKPRYVSRPCCHRAGSRSGLTRGSVRQDLPRAPATLGLALAEPRTGPNRSGALLRAV